MNAEETPLEELEEVIENNLEKNPHFYDDPNIPQPTVHKTINEQRFERGLGAQWVGEQPDPSNPYQAAIESVVQLRALIGRIQEINQHRAQCSWCDDPKFHAGGSET